jgi:hypothetical protein
VTDAKLYDAMLSVDRAHLLDRVCLEIKK